MYRADMHQLVQGWHPREWKNWSHTSRNDLHSEEHNIPYAYSYQKGSNMKDFLQMADCFFVVFKMTEELFLITRDKRDMKIECKEWQGFFI
jgi:hypothetical protein